MNRKFKMKLVASLFVPALSVGMAGFAYGQEKTSPAPAPKAVGTTPMATPATGAAPMATSPAAVAPEVKAFRDMRASKLIGSDVRNAQNENLGEIKDLVVDVNNGRVHYAVLSFGGFLGLGDKLFAYPVSVFTPTSDSDKVLLNVDKAKLKAAPGFESKRYPEWNDAKYSGEVDRYFGTTAAAKSIPNQMLRRASELIGKDVNDRNGKDVGEIDDLVVNMGNGRIHYAVLEFDKSWNLNDKLLAVPLSAFTYTAGRKDLVMNVDKAKLDAKLAFDKNRWPDINDPMYIIEVDRNLGMFVPTAATTSNSSMRDRTAAGAGTVFADLDSNKDGMLSAAEAGKDSKVMGMWKQLDKDGDGAVSRAEFMTKQTAIKKS